MSRGYRARVTSSGARQARRTHLPPLLLLQIQRWPLITSSPSPFLLCVTFPLLFPSIHTLLSRYLAVLFLILPSSRHPLFRYFFFSPDCDLWPEGCPWHHKSSSSSQLPLSTTQGKSYCTALISKNQAAAHRHALIYCVFYSGSRSTVTFETCTHRITGTQM